LYFVIDDHPFMKYLSFFLLSTLFWSGIGLIQGQSAIYSSDVLHHPNVGSNGIVSSQHTLATESGIEILKQGGNAVDAAVAVGFSLAVVLPRAGNLGGGGFMLVHSPKKNETKALNYREMAPLKASRDMYLDDKGNVDNGLIKASYQAAGVPGAVAGLVQALETYGTMELKDVMAPAIRLADKGFPVTYDLSRLLKSYEGRLKKWPATAEIFYKGDSYYEPGDILVQADLAWSLKQIANKGAKAFYGGEVGQRLVADMEKNNGLISMKDLDAYEVEIMEPVWGEYRGYQIASMPPPSSGGIHIIQMLNVLEGFPLGYLGHNTAETLHLMTEAMKLAYADRSEHLGDPNFWEVPSDWLTSKEYANEQRNGINRSYTRSSDDIKPGTPTDYESNETTQFTVIDANGNVVTNTYTLNFSFGSGIVAKGTGIMLNNEMDDFSAKPGVANAFGLLGGEANSVQPKKRPLSSMTPTMVFKDGKPFFATGSPGGSRIITTVLQILLNIIDHDMNVAEASHAPRIHHQWYPDKLFIEKGVNYDTQSLLRARGHEIQQIGSMGSTQTIMIKDGLLYGASDPRRPDAKTMAY
jgi:gamma-glutamyltranspeptidase/glutathione hydrolase